MGKKKRTIIEEEAPEETPFDVSPEEEAQILEQERTAELLGEFQARFVDQPAKVLVEKYDGEGDWALCRKYPLAGFEQEHVKAEFGGGKYRGTLLDPQGKYVKGGRINFKFAESVIKEVAPPQPANPLDSPVVAMIMKSTESQNAMLLGLMQAMISAQAATAPKSGGLGEIVEVMKSLNGLTATKEKPLDNLKETLGLMKLVKEVTGSGDEGESKGGLLGDIKEFLEIWPMVKDQLAAIKPPTAPAAAPGAIAPETPKTVTIAGEQPQMDPLTKKIIELVPKFVGGAQANAPVGEWAGFLLDSFDVEIVPLLLPTMKEKYKPFIQNEDDVYDAVLKMAKDPKEREQIFAHIKPFAPYKPWINSVIDEAVRLAELPDDEAPPIVTTEGGGSSILTAANGKDNAAH